MSEDLDKELEDLAGALHADADVSLDDVDVDVAGEAAEAAPADEAASGAEGIELDDELQSMLDGSKDESESEPAAEDPGGIEEGMLSPAGSEDVSSGGVPAAPTVQTLDLPADQAVNLEFLLDLKLHVTFEVGRSKMLISDLLTLGQGSVIELHRLVGDELDLLVNGRLIAKGAVVVVNEKFGCRITEIIAPEDRVKYLGAL